MNTKTIIANVGVNDNTLTIKNVSDDLTLLLKLLANERGESVGTVAKAILGEWFHGRKGIDTVEWEYARRMNLKARDDGRYRYGC